MGWSRERWSGTGGGGLLANPSSSSSNQIPITSFTVPVEYRGSEARANHFLILWVSFYPGETARPMFFYRGRPNLLGHYDVARRLYVFQPYHERVPTEAVFICFAFLSGPPPPPSCSSSGIGETDAVGVMHDYGPIGQPLSIITAQRRSELMRLADITEAQLTRLEATQAGRVAPGMGPDPAIPYPPYLGFVVPPAYYNPGGFYGLPGYPTSPPAALGHPNSQPRYPNGQPGHQNVQPYGAAAYPNPGPGPYSPPQYDHTEGYVNRAYFEAHPSSDFIYESEAAAQYGENEDDAATFSPYPYPPPVTAFAHNGEYDESSSSDSDDEP